MEITKKFTRYKMNYKKKHWILRRLIQKPQYLPSDENVNSVNFWYHWKYSVLNFKYLQIKSYRFQLQQIPPVSVLIFWKKMKVKRLELKVNTNCDLNPTVNNNLCSPFWICQFQLQIKICNFKCPFQIAILSRIQPQITIRICHFEFI